jgi:hypothetical protein
MKTKKNTAAKKSAKKTTKKTAAPKYTRLDCEDMGAILADATTSFVRDPVLADDIIERSEVEEYEEAAGTFFIQYSAKTWRDAAAFNAAIIGAAFAAGYFAEPSATWDGELTSDDGTRRLVSVFVAAADFMDEDGHAVA